MNKKKTSIIHVLMLTIFFFVGALFFFPAVPVHAKGSLTKLTQEQYLQKVNQFILHANWDNGSAWAGSARPKASKLKGKGCWAYMADFVKKVYGRDANDGVAFKKIEDIRSGDIIHYWYYNANKEDNTQHWVCVISRVGNKLYTAEGNYSKKVRIKYGSYTIDSILKKVKSYNPKYGKKKYPGARFQGWHYLPASMKSIPQHFVVKYQSGGASGSMADTVVPYGKATALRNNTFTRSGYTFKGWNVYCATDKTWAFVKTVNGTTSYKWAASKTPTDGYQLRVLPNGSSLAKTVSYWGGVLKLYPVWEAVSPAAKAEEASSGASSGAPASPVTPSEPAVTKPASTLSVSKAHYPKGTKAKGSAFSILGIVESNYTIKSVSAKVTGSDGSVKFSGTASPAAKTYDLSKLDAKMTFSSLANGTYNYVVTASDEMGTKTLINASFKVADSAGVKGSSLNYPKTITAGKGFGVYGTVSSSSKIKNVQLFVYKIDGTEVLKPSASPNAKTYNIHNLDSKMTFAKLKAGKYLYQVVVTDAKDVRSYLVTKFFTVK